MKFKEKRMSSFVERGNKLISDGKTEDAMKLISRGLQYYSENVINAISPYAKSDAGLIVLILRHISEEICKNNPGAKELADGLEECVEMPDLKEIEKTKSANRR